MLAALASIHLAVKILTMQNLVAHIPIFLTLKLNLCLKHYTLIFFIFSWHQISENKRFMLLYRVSSSD
jgi:hypothetical protein